MFNSRDLEIIEKNKQGKTCYNLALEYNVSFKEINDIIYNYKKCSNFLSKIIEFEGESDFDKIKLCNLCDFLKFDTRSIRALINSNIKTIGELIDLTEEDICKIRSVGELSKNHIKKCIDDYKEKCSQVMNMSIQEKNLEKLLKTLENVSMTKGERESIESLSNWPIEIIEDICSVIEKVKNKY